MVLLVVAGFFLQMDWIQRIKKQSASDIAPNALADKLGQWMLQTKGIEPGSVAGAPGVETIECGNCMGTGNVLSDEGKKRICPICQGVGSRLIRYLDSSDRICPNCVGMGRAEDPDTGEVGTCPRCGGRGLIRSQAALEAAPSGN